KGDWAGVICLVEGCKRPVDSLGLCTKHYAAERETRNLAAGRLCTVEGCGRGEYARGLCTRCRDRQRRGAPPIDASRRLEEAPRLSDADAQAIRRRWWAGEADVNQLASQHGLADFYVDLVLRRLLYDVPPFVPGERPLHPDEKLVTDEGR